MPNRDSFFAAPRRFACAAALLVITAMPAAAQEPSAFQKFLGKIGVLEIPEDPIDYRERAPLVVPPSSALVEPRSAADITKINPDWPVDADIKRVSPAQVEAAKKADEIFYSGARLSPDEMRRGSVAREAATRQRAAPQPGPENLDTNRLLPSQLGFKGWGAKQEEKVVFSGEPERRYLTDPPPGLLTPSADAPYGVVTQRAQPWKRDPFDRGLQDGQR